MDFKQLYREETKLEPYQDIEIENNFTRHYVNWLEQQLLIQRVSNWVSVKDDMPTNCNQVFVKYENGKYGINEWWKNDNCWKYQFDNMIVKEWCETPCY